MKRSLALLAGLIALGVGADRLSAQESDVELLGQIYGTRPPAAYYEQIARDPRAYRLEQGLAVGRGLPASGVRSGAASLRLGVDGGPAGIVLGSGRVQGTFRFPVLLGLFSDSPPAPFTAEHVQDYFFDGPNPTGTISDLYREMSNGAVELVGEVKDWHQVSLRRDSVAGGASGLGGSARVGEFIMELLARLPSGMDWGRYDNDGADGRPNSGDDDGYVDILAVIHPTHGAECGGDRRSDRIWSHKWNLRSAIGQEYVTGTRTPSGGRVRIADYTIQPVYACDQQGLNDIGVFAHELGHGFGLPDLYADVHAGAGRWDLMGSGSWGCSTRLEPERPCHMGAWSKHMLGWLDVQTLPFGTDWRSVTLDPVESTGDAVAIPAGDGSGEYFLIENRQRIGFDSGIPETGLLIWHVDPWLIDDRLRYNAVNENGGRMGVWLQQADGLNQLALTPSLGGNRGDAGDPFTGAGERSAFHAGTSPRSFTNTKSSFELRSRGIPGAGAAGVTITDIARSGQRVSFRVLPRYQTLRVRSVGQDGTGLFKVDGLPLADATVELRSAPFQRHTIEAAAGAEIEDGIRRGFSGWEDAPGGDRVRTWTTAFADADLVASYGGPREVRFRLALDGRGSDVTPGSVTTVPASADLWFDEGIEVAVTAVARTGFAFRAWSGALVGATNPQLLRMDQPRDASATFDLAFGFDAAARIEFPAAVSQTIELQARNANPPVAWTILSGALPEGMSLNRSGSMVGEALAAGSFPLELRARDEIGLEATGTVTVTVTVPKLGTGDLAAQFLSDGGSLTFGQERYLDLAGNGNGVYDLGDFRAYVLANPDAPTHTPAAAASVQVVPLVDFGPPEAR